MTKMPFNRFAVPMFLGGLVVFSVGCLSPTEWHAPAHPDHVELRERRTYEADGWLRSESRDAFDEQDRIRRIQEFREDRRRRFEGDD